MKSTNKGKRMSYAIVFLLLCMAITSIAVKAPENNGQETEKEITKPEEYETEVISEIKVEDDEDVLPVEEEIEEIVPETITVSYSKPVYGDIIADYSMDVPVYSKTMDDYRTHRGVDFKVNDGEDVRASEKGVDRKSVV